MTHVAVGTRSRTGQWSTVGFVYTPVDPWGSDLESRGVRKQLEHLVKKTLHEERHVEVVRFPR